MTLYDLLALTESDQVRFEPDSWIDPEVVAALVREALAGRERQPEGGMEAAQRATDAALGREVKP